MTKKMIVALFLMIILLAPAMAVVASTNEAGSASPEASVLRAGWTEYKNVQYGYAIDYPKEWSCLEARKWNDSFDTPMNLQGSELQKVVFLEPQYIGGTWQGIFELSVLPNPKGLTAEAWVNFIKKENKKDKVAGSITGEAAGMDALGVIVDENDFKSIYLYLPVKKVVFFFNYIEENKGDDRMKFHTQTYNDILTSFRLIETTTPEEKTPE